MAAVSSAGAALADGQSLAAEAFRRLYPDQYFSRFLADGIRPDGRTLGRARATTIGLGAISVADGSALVRVGNTTALAAVRLDLQRPAESSPDRGSVAFTVEVAPFSSADWRPGKAPELVSFVSERLSQIMGGGSSRPPLDLTQLCIAEGKACWAAEVSVYILNADGSVLDTVLLAVIAALSSAVLPSITTTAEGEIHRRTPAEEASATGEFDTDMRKRIELGTMPLSLTCCSYGEHLLVDATAEEEAIATSSVTVVLDERNTLHGKQ
jgi:exosome complex component RRP43